MVNVCALASGSNGNCYYVGNANDAILVDAGVSCKQIIMRMEERGLCPSMLRAVFITHEHADHIRGARVLSKKLGVPVYYTYGTWNKAHKSSKAPFHAYIHLNKPLQLNGFEIHAFAKRHDAQEPCSYRINYSGISVGVMTDIGSVCENVIKHFAECDVVFLETNYDEKMLHEGAYPWILKKRIASDVGHLSNNQALELVRNHANGRLKALFLSHLSGENNTPEIAYHTFLEYHKKIKIIKTSRYSASEILSLQ